YVDRGRMRPFRRTDPLSLQILHGFDLALPVHVERGEAEQPGTDHGEPDDVGVCSADLGRELGKGQFRQIEFAVRGETREALVVAESEPGVVDAFGFDKAEPEIAEMIV